ncbi:unannotated protein [freshwater metagenome]|uniref:Unannotated protein n=1 Tax=freshwater metagenome TaxID=449393 RepID=A0A6J7S442_9ZZZZ|nr:hypothetical protein [Actinomycetota bacterium]MSW37801.1 hypothetical protein [Actinomycetota bacterium]
MNITLNAVVNGLILGCVYGIAGMTFGVLYRITKVFHISFAAIGTLGAVVAVAVSGTSGSWTAITLGIIAGAAVAAVVTAAAFLALYRPLIRRGASAGITFIASLGAFMVIEAVVAIVAGPDDRKFSVMGFTRQSEVLGLKLSGLHVASLALFVLVAAAISFYFAKTRAGRQTRALIGNPEQAELVGIRVLLISTLMCAAMGGISIVAFAVNGMNSSVTFAGSLPLTLFGVLAMMLGGVDNLVQTGIAGLAVGAVGGLAAAILPGQWSSTIVFALAMVYIVIRPTGGFLRVRAT